MLHDGLDNERRLFWGALEPVFPIDMCHAEPWLVPKDPLEVAAVNRSRHKVGVSNFEPKKDSL